MYTFSANYFYKEFYAKSNKKMPILEILLLAIPNTRDTSVSLFSAPLNSEEQPILSQVYALTEFTLFSEPFISFRSTLHFLLN